MHKLSSETLTRVKRVLTVTGIILIFWHSATACFASVLDCWWLSANDRIFSLSTNLLALLSWLIWGSLGIAASLWAIYSFYKEEYKTLLRQRIALIWAPLVVAVGMAGGYYSMVVEVTTGKRPELAVMGGMATFLWCTLLGLVMLVAAYCVADLLKRLWQPVETAAKRS